jgi:carboxyl-terminal processing protease
MLNKEQIISGNLINKKRILKLAIVFLLCCSSHLECSSSPSTPIAGDYSKFISPIKEQSANCDAIVDQLNNIHYQHLLIDDSLSSKVFERYLSNLDPSRSYFLSSDIKEFEAYRYQLDDALKPCNLDIPFRIYNRYRQHIAERLIFITNCLNRGLHDMKFDVDESFETERANAPWPVNNDELDELWRKRLKSSVLNLKLADKSLDEITEILKKRYNSQLHQSSQINSEDIFQIYMNSFTQIYDPHTQYFSPRESENFNIHMSLSLEGIGAILQKEDEFTKVVSLVAAGPADKTKQLKPGDRIVGVGQGPDSEIVDVVGWRLDDVVQLIRGPKQTLVRLEIIPADINDEHQTKIVEIMRNTVKLEEQSAKKQIIELEHKGRAFKVGVINIPAFYLDFKALQSGDQNYKSTTRDVKRLLEELAESKVDGLIIDLRDNSGGSLQEVNTLTGLFIKEGPVVQVRSSNRNVDVLWDKDPDILYSGPLVVLVNRLSASASEIFAAAIQDYGRGIIIGGQTFGKGTVQSLIPLNRGQLKATMAKFYRISGESTQQRGVIPDISYPDLYDMEKIGESSLPESLSWDKIQSASYNGEDFNLNKIVDKLKELHINRMEKSPDYIFMLDMIEHLKKLREKTSVSLNENVRRKEDEETKKWRLELENKRLIAKNLKPIKDLSEIESKTDDITGDKAKEDDPLLIESGYVLVDLTSLL